jgi:nucleoside-diphosphate-sugar epimerase
LKILVTGGGGFLGVPLMERLLSHGHRDIRCLVRSQRGRLELERLLAAYPDARIELVTGNLMQREDAEAAVQDVDVIFHLAAAMRGSAADMFMNSVVASRNLLEAVGGRPLRIVLISSFGVYGVAGLGRGALIDENTPLEPHPERRDVYSHAKLRQEQLFSEYQKRNNFKLVIIRPGVIYGPGGGHFSARVGLPLFGVFLHLGRGNRLPLTFVENCAEAIAVAGLAPTAGGEVFNVHDDDLPTSRQYLRRYRREVRKIRFMPVPYWCLRLLSRIVAWYYHYSKGQLPAVFTPYKSASLWAGNRFENSKLKAVGWKQLVPTDEGLRRAFAYFKAHPPQ